MEVVGALVALVMMMLCVGAPVAAVALAVSASAQATRRRKLAAAEARRLAEELRVAIGDHDAELAKDGTKRPLNICLNCGDRWFPRGQDRSDRCGKCGDEAGVAFATPTVLAKLGELQATYRQLREIEAHHPEIRVQRAD